MRIRLWVMLAITYILLMSIVALLSYVVGHILLQMPLMDVYIIIGLSIFAGTVGMLIVVIITLARLKK